MTTEKQIKAIECINSGRYIFKDDKIFNRKGKELFTNALPTGYIQCILYNGKRCGRGIKVIVYKHILIYLNKHGQYSPELVIGHMDNINTNNHPDNLKAINYSVNKLMSPTVNINNDYNCIRREDIDNIRELMNHTTNKSLIARQVGKNRLSVLYIIKQIRAGKPLKYG